MSLARLNRVARLTLRSYPIILTIREAILTGAGGEVTLKGQQRKMNHSPRVPLLVLACMVVITIVVMLLAGAIGLLSANRDTISPTERIRQRTEVLLQSAIYSRPTNASTLVPVELAACGNWLPEILKRNNNQYSIVIMGVWGDGASPVPGGTGSITAIVHIVFPDDTRIEMQYYAYSLDLCRLIQDGSEQF